MQLGDGLTNALPGTSQITLLSDVDDPQAPALRWHGGGVHWIEGLQLVLPVTVCSVRAVGYSAPSGLDGHHSSGGSSWASSPASALQQREVLDLLGLASPGI